MGEIKKTEVKTFLLNEICDKCKTGYMSRDYSKSIMLTNPVKVYVKCNNCDYNKIVFENEVYPKFSYEEIIIDSKTNKISKSEFIENYLNCKILITFNLEEYENLKNKIKPIFNDIYNIDDFMESFNFDNDTYKDTEFILIHNKFILKNYRKKYIIAINDELIKNHYLNDIKINYSFEDIITIFNN